MRKLFGTDGIRGIANEKLTAEVALRLGKAFAVNLSKNARFKQVLVSRDTRVSGPMIVASFVSGLNSMGFSAILTGILPTPATSFLINALDVDGGVMITASHNQPVFNGIKFYNSAGEKIPLEEQNSIEKIYYDIDNFLGCDAEDIGLISRKDLGKLWVDHLLNTLKIPSLSGYKIALDLANGATYNIVPYVFKRLGAHVYCYNNTDHGEYINIDCGSTHYEKFVVECVKNQVDLGFTFDGDGDRVLVVTSNGRVLDGTDLMYIFAKYMHKRGLLKGDTVVTTTIANCGLEESLGRLGIKLVRTDVGGLFIREEMIKNGYNLGGEENGHIILGDVGAESCGLSTALMLLKVLIKDGESVEKLLVGLERTDVVTSDIPVSDRQKALVSSGVLEEYVQALEEELGLNGRIILRASGTEDVVRVLVEGRDHEKLLSLCTQLQNRVVAL